MKKLTLLFDSSCGKTKKEINALGGFYIPIILDLNGKSYESGVNISSKELENSLDKNSKIKTAACTLGNLDAAFSEALKHSEKVFYISLSKHLSSTNSTAVTLSKEAKFKGKVIVYDSLFTSPFLTPLVNQIFDLVNKSNFNETKLTSWLDQYKDKLFGWFAPENLEFLHHGGRISKIQYVMGSLFKIVPIIPTSGGLINTGVEKVRSIEKAYSKAIENALNKWDEIPGEKKIWLVSDHKSNHIEKLKEKLSEKGVIEKNIIITILTPEIVAHVGPRYWGIGILPIFN